MAKKRHSSAPFDAIKKAAYIKAILEDKLGRCAAAKKVGVDPWTVTRHTKQDKVFATAVSEAEMQVEGEDIEDVERALVNAAKGGNVTAIQVYLYNRAPDRWQDRRNLNVQLPPDEARRKLAAILGMSTDDIPA